MASTSPTGTTFKENSETLYIVEAANLHCRGSELTRLFFPGYFYIDVFIFSNEYEFNVFTDYQTAS
jgi:hypothetical protein